MRTDLVMGVGLPDSHDGVIKQLYYGSRKQSTGLFELNGKTLRSKHHFPDTQMILLDKPFRIPRNATLLAIRTSSLNLFEALGVPIQWEQWITVGQVIPSLGEKNLITSENEQADSEPWSLMYEYRSSDNFLHRAPISRSGIYFNSSKFFKAVQMPALGLIAEIVNQKSCESELRLVGEKPYLTWSPYNSALSGFSVEDLQITLRNRLWDEYGLWFNWFRSPILSGSQTSDSFLEREDVRRKQSV